MKKVKVLVSAIMFLAGVFTSGILTGCALSIGESGTDDGLYGSLTVESDRNSARYVDVNSIKFARVFISGEGIESGKEPASALEDVNNGAVNSVKISKIPLGNNRVVTVYAYDSSKSQVKPVVLRAVTNIAAGDGNSVAVSKNTTALGNVFDALNKSGASINGILSNEISSKIDSTVHYSLIDASSIASDYLNGSLKNKSSSDYVISAATLSYKSNYSKKVKIVVADPLSDSKEIEASSSGTIENIAPGTWKVSAIEDGKEIFSTTATFKAGKASSVELGNVEVKDKIIVHAKGYTYVYLWETGKSGKDYQMTEDANGWYSYTINAKEMNIIFKKGTSWDGKTDDLSRTEGEYWFYNGKWYDSNPEDGENPVIVSFTANKTTNVSGEIELTVSASDNLALDNAVISVDGNVVETVEMNGTEATAVSVINTSALQNGSHELSCYVTDKAGNVSDEIKTISITTQNVNLPPVAVISGVKKVKPDSEVTYKASSSYDQNGGTIKSYKWTVSGSGATVKSGTASEELVVKTGKAGNSFSVSLVVTDNENASSEKVTFDCDVVEVDPDWDFRDETIYFLLTTRFYDGDSSNNYHCGSEPASQKSSVDASWRGDFAGLEEKLDYLKALGFTAIWINPIVQNKSGMDYHGYHALNFKKIDERYAAKGKTAEESFQSLIDAAHSKGIKIIQDVVFNHTGNWGEENLFMIPGADWKERKANVEKGTGDSKNIYHHTGAIGGGDWDNYNAQIGQVDNDCLDLNTENPTVYNYLIDAYKKYIEMGVDGFRVDTVKHVSRLSFNSAILPPLQEAGGDGFYMFGEVCTKGSDIWYRGAPGISTCFYTWGETGEWANCWTSDWETNYGLTASHYNAQSTSNQPTSSNAFLKGVTYHAPDYSRKSFMNVIDFQVHWDFINASKAYSRALDEDQYFNDSTWNVVYVDSHDFAPDEQQKLRYAGGTDAWAENLDMMFTFRGIPCVYYGSEVEFQAGKEIDPGNCTDNTGRAYFGDYLEGTVSASGAGEYTATGTVKQTLESTLSQHIMRLNQIRAAVPALRKGQYKSYSNLKFVRRYTSNNVDSVAVVSISESGSFSGLPAGKYIDVVSGDVQTIGEGGTITTKNSGQGSMAVYVNATLDPSITGKIGKSGKYLK